MKALSENKNRNKNQKDTQKDKSSNPSSNNNINEKNIMNFFVFDENIDNIINNSKNNKNTINIDSNNNKINIKEEESKEQKKRIDYNVNSFITSTYRPDLYSPYGIISGNKYRLRMAPGKSSQKIEEIDEECEENEVKKEEEEKENENENDKVDLSSSFSSNEKDNNEDILKNTRLNRYYNIEPDITVKCYTCGQIGHKKDACPNYDIKFCYRCLSTKHEDRDCDKIKCFRCNKLGHKTFNCQLKEKQLLICDSCHCIGHKKNECLIKPMEISKLFLKYNNLCCINCGSNNHVLCSLVTRELPEIFEDEDYPSDYINSESDADDDGSSLTPKAEEENESKEKKKKKKEKRILEDLRNEDIKKTIFCGFCTGHHRNEDCPKKTEEKYNNKFDEQRKSLGKKIFVKRSKEIEEEEDNRYNNLFGKRNRNNNNNNDNRSYQKNK